MGHPSYIVTEGEILLDGQNILEWETDERARAGLYMAFQYPVEIPGITVGRFLKRAVEIHTGELSAVKAPLPGKVGAPAAVPKAGVPVAGTPPKKSSFVKDLRSAMDFMEMDQQFINRYLNDGFSGGEKKRMEVLQSQLWRYGHYALSTLA
jgi:Fe-S cluster assembly ATP-binding protein